MWLFTERRKQIEATRFELANEIVQPSLWANHVIVIGEDLRSTCGCRSHSGSLWGVVLACCSCSSPESKE